MSDIKSWRERARKTEEIRTADIYGECIKRGCDKQFLQKFDARLWAYPFMQSKAFIDLKNRHSRFSVDADDMIRQWTIFLKVAIEKRPGHEKSSEWKRSVDYINDSV